MFELLVILSRYFFVFYILYFLWQGICYIRIERYKLDIDKNIPIEKQKMTILFMHTKAFLILSYIPSTFEFNSSAAVVGVLWIIFFLGASFFVSRLYKNSCPLVWNGVFFLTSIGSITLQRLEQALARQQLLWFFVSFSVMLLIPLVISIIPKFERLEIFYLVAGLGLLLSTFLFGSEIFGSTRWIQIGDVSFQPSEIVTFLYIFYLASVFRKKLTFKQMIFPSTMAVIHVLVLVLQRNLGSALIFFMTFMIIMYISTGRELLFALGMVFASIGSVIAYNFFGHVRVRVAIWQDPWVDVHGIGNQIVQSLFAIGTWGLWGSGLTRGMPGFVPIVSRDLPFAAITEEFGGIFAIAIIGIYIMIFYRGVHIALRCKRRYYSLLAVGFTGVLAFQTFIIIGGTIKLIPLTGITLPFVSYGGSSMFVSVMMIGILQWIYMYYEK